MGKSDAFKMVRGDLEPDVTFQLMLKESGYCLRPRDLTELTPRAMFYKRYEISTGVCGRSIASPAENALFHRLLVKQETDLASAVVAAPVSDAEYDPIEQPQSAQRISIEITGFSVGGDITITGTDIDGNVISEVVTIAGNGTVFTTAAFEGIDLIDADAGTQGILVEAGSDFTFRMFVHDGMATLTWVDGDTDEAGDYFLRIEVVDQSGEVETAIDELWVTIKDKVKRPIPVIVSVSPDPAAVAGAITLTGTGFLDAVNVTLIESDTGDETDVALTSIAEGTLVTDLIPVIPGGRYGILVEGAEDPSLASYFDLLPKISTFSPSSASPGDTITIDGDGFTAATGADLIASDGTVVPMINFSIVSDDQVTADVDPATATGTYSVRVTGALNVSNSLGTLTVS